MKMLFAILFATVLPATPFSAQTLPDVKGFLESRPPTKAASRSVNYRVAFHSSHREKQKHVFQDSGSLSLGKTDQGAIWVAATQPPSEFKIGETTPSPEGERWFKELCEPSRMNPWVDAGAFLSGLIGKLPLKAQEVPAKGVGELGDQILVYRLEAPRPVAKIWRFKSIAGEARLQVRKDGAPVSLQVIQSYSGDLSPRFGRYMLNRRETWTFAVGEGQVHATKYQLFQRRQDWMNYFEADVEMTGGALP